MNAPTKGTAILIGIWIATGLAGCGGDTVSPAAENVSPAAEKLTQAQVIVGANLLPPVVEVAGSVAAASDLSPDELPPDIAATRQDDDLLPPG